MSSEGLIVVMSAPSGGGKTTLKDRLRERMSDLQYSVSVTTRNPRGKEVEGKDYYFVSREVFKKWREDGKFVEWAEVHGNLYGTPKEFIERNVSQGENLLLDLDVRGALQIKKQFPKAVLIFIAPPSIAVLEKRLLARGTDTPEEVRKRLLRANEEMRVAEHYDHVIVNEDLEKALEELEKVVSDCRRAG